MANYLVTGAAGFIGAAVARHFVGVGDTVVTIDNLSTGFRENVPAKVEFIEGDCGDPDIYEQLGSQKFDAIFHIAGQSSGEISFDDPIYDIRTNAESTLLLLKYSLATGCKRFIYASTMSVYGIKQDRAISEEEEARPESFYGVAKLASEHYLRIYEQYGIEHTSLRLFNVYGPGQNMENLRQGMVSIFLAQILKDGQMHVKGPADRYRDFIHITDVVEAFVRCLSHPKSKGKVINVATGKKTFVHEIIDHLTAGKLPVKYEGATSGDIHGIYAEVSQLDKTLGKWEKVQLQEGLVDMMSYYSDQATS